MSKSSWMMGGGSMQTHVDAGRGQQIGSHISLAGRVLGIKLSLEEVITERVPPWRKAWETIGEPCLLVIGAYRMGFRITPQRSGSTLEVFIDYALPQTTGMRWLGYLLSGSYARWCTRRMANDVTAYFASRTA